MQDKKISIISQWELKALIQIVKPESALATACTHIRQVISKAEQELCHLIMASNAVVNLRSQMSKDGVLTKAIELGLEDTITRATNEAAFVRAQIAGYNSELNRISQIKEHKTWTPYDKHRVLEAYVNYVLTPMQIEVVDHNNIECMMDDYLTLHWHTMTDKQALKVMDSDWNIHRKFNYMDCSYNVSMAMYQLWVSTLTAAELYQLKLDSEGRRIKFPHAEKPEPVKDSKKRTDELFETFMEYDDPCKHSMEEYQDWCENNLTLAQKDDFAKRALEYYANHRGEASYDPAFEDRKLHIAKPENEMCEACPMAIGTDECDLAKAFEMCKHEGK